MTQLRGIFVTNRPVVEHRFRGNGVEAVNVFMPYRKRMLRGITYGEIFASAADPLVFA